MMAQLDSFLMIEIRISYVNKEKYLKKICADEICGSSVL